MLVILKIPVVYLCAVVWWAIKAEPRPLEGAGQVARLQPTPLGPEPACDWSRRRVAVRPTGHSRAEGAPSPAAGW